MFKLLKKYGFILATVLSLAVLITFSIFSSVCSEPNRIRMATPANAREIIALSDGEFAALYADKNPEVYGEDGLKYTLELDQDEAAIACAASTDRIFVGTSARNIRIYDAADGREISCVSAYYTPQRFSVNSAGEALLLSGISSTKMCLQKISNDGTITYSHTVSEKVESFLLCDTGEVGYATNFSYFYLLDENGSMKKELELSYIPTEGEIRSYFDSFLIPGQNNVVMLVDAEGNVKDWELSSYCCTGAVIPEGILILCGKNYYLLDGANLKGVSCGYMEQAVYTGDSFAISDGSVWFRADLTQILNFVKHGNLFGLFVALAVLGGICFVIFCMLSVPYLRRALKKFCNAFWRSLKLHKISYLLLLPTFALLALFSYYPAIWGLALAFMEYVPGSVSRFVGFDNFITVFNNAYFWSSMSNMLIFLVTDLLKLVFPILFAEFLMAVRNEKFRYWSRVLLFLPGILPGVAGLMIWKDGFLGSNGVINEILRFIGLGSWAQPWLANESTAIWGLIFIGFPWIGSYLIFYGALNGIPKSLLEAAELDGCNWWRRVIRIDLPMIFPQIKYMFITTFIGSVQNFSLIYVTTNGGPGNSTYTPMFEMYLNMTQFGNYGAAAAMGIIMFVVIFAVTLMNFKVMKSNVE